MQSPPNGAPLFDTGDKIALATAIIAMGIAIWQAYEARRSRKGTEKQAEIAPHLLEQTTRQSAATEKSATSAMLSLGATERSAGAAEDQVVVARRALEATEIQVESARQQVAIMLEQLADQRADRAARVDTEERMTMAEVLKTGHRWTGALEKMIFLIAGRFDRSIPQAREITSKFSDTNDAYRSALIQAKVTVTDEHLQGLTGLLDAGHAKWRDAEGRLGDTTRDVDGTANHDDLRWALAVHKTNVDFLNTIEKVIERRIREGLPPISVSQHDAIETRTRDTTAADDAGAG